MSRKPRSDRPRRVEDFDTVLAHHLLIGEAKGILMERFGISSEAAFAFLSRVSQETNRRIWLVAGDLVTTRRLPEAYSIPKVVPRPPEES